MVHVFLNPSVPLEEPSHQGEGDVELTAVSKLDDDKTKTSALQEADGRRVTIFDSPFLQLAWYMYMCTCVCVHASQPQMAS